MTRIQDSRPVAPAEADAPANRGGWVKPLDLLADQLEAEITGLKERIKNGLRGGQPASYSAKRVFSAEDAVVGGTQWNIAQPLNYVLRDGTTYDIPVQFPGPGTFLARKMRVNVSQRVWCPQYGHEMLFTMSSLDMPVLGQQMSPVNAQPPKGGFQPVMSFLDGVRLDTTYKLSVFPTLPSMPVTTDPNNRYVLKPSLNFFWNLQDSKSGRWLADDVMSHAALMPRTFQPVAYAPPDLSSPTSTLLSHYSATAHQPLDGGFFHFSAPWLVERDGQLNLRFRPVSPVLQYDSSVALNALVNPNLPANGSFMWDDREMGRRNQAVTVQVEIHGRRFENAQDLQHAGALSR